MSTSESAVGGGWRKHTLLARPPELQSQQVLAKLENAQHSQDPRARGLNCIVNILNPRTCECDSIGNRVLADVIKFRRGPTGLEQTLVQWLVSSREAENLNPEALGRALRIEVTCLPVGDTKDCRQTPEAGRGKEQVLPQKEPTLMTLDLGLNIQNCEGMHFCRVRPPCLWYFTAALGHSHTW